MNSRDKINMTTLAGCAGCAAKAARNDLAQVLRRLPAIDNPNVLQGYKTADDAGVYRISDDIALVQTVDFFPPIVDDPFMFGSIAAANSISDIYAMGAKPVSALNILGFPRKKLTNDDIEDILRGAAEKANEAGCPIIGGHTIEAPEPFFGLSVTGIVHPERFITNGGGRAGDLLVLTKPIGTGVITTAVKADLVPAEILKRAMDIMNTLNRSASEAMLIAGAHACTDVTGFGLLGHLNEMCIAAGLGAELHAAEVPLIAPVVLELIEQGITTKLTNFKQSEMFTVYSGGISEELRIALCDPQTSGGLLVAIPPENVGIFMGEMKNYELPVAVIGSLVADAEMKIKIKD
jgi:selenide, water dikinase